MGTAIAKALKQNFEPLSRLAVSERDPAKHEKFAALEIDVTDSNAEACRDADVVILAVKPQDFGAVEIGGKLKGDALVVSIMAGVEIEKIREILDGHSYIARVMPNLPALVSEGISGFYAPDLEPEQKKIVCEILKTFGDAVEVENEDDMDKITALSGSGPAYVFYFIETLRDAGVGLGLEKDAAEKLALKTVLGSAKFAEIDIASLEELRGRVTSKGGTTEKALQVLEKHGLKEIMREAVEAAYKRAKELSD